MIITETISGDTPTGVSLTSLLRSDTHAAPSGVSLPLAFANAGGGVWNATFTDPSTASCMYTYTFTLTFSDGITLGPFAGSKTSSGTTPTCYFANTVSSDALAAALPTRLVAAYLAAGGGDKFAALSAATIDVDQGMKYQGRKYDPAQLTQFPRVAYETAGRVRPQGIVTLVIPPAATDTVWDWDATNQVAIVPQAVLQATVYQADSILRGDRDDRLDETHDGVTQTQNSGLQESRDRTAPGADSMLCRRAWQLLRNYRLVSGRIL